MPPKKPIVTTTNRYRIEAVDRSLVVLDTIASHQGVSAAALAELLQANRSLIFRILSTLGERGFVVKDSRNLYWLGPQLLYLGLQAGGENLLINASGAVLDDLLQQTKESIVVIVRDQLDTVRVAYRDSSHLIRVPTGFAAKGGLHLGGASKILLAHAPQEVIDQVIEKHLAEFVPTRLRTREQVLKFLATIRHDGYYAAVGEVHPDLFSVSAPVRDIEGRTIASLAIVGPTSRLTASLEESFVKQVVAGAARISSQMR
jgi:IclR family KDG regulon transcriptional repressor